MPSALSSSVSALLCPFLSVSVRLCPSLSVSVRLCPSLYVFNRPCPSLSVPIRFCPSVCFHLWPFLFVFVLCQSVRRCKLSLSRGFHVFIPAAYFLEIFVVTWLLRFHSGMNKLITFLTSSSFCKHFFFVKKGILSSNCPYFALYFPFSTWPVLSKWERIFTKRLTIKVVSPFEKKKTALGLICMGEIDDYILLKNIRKELRNKLAINWGD